MKVYIIYLIRRFSDDSPYSPSNLPWIEYQLAPAVYHPNNENVLNQPRFAPYGLPENEHLTGIMLPPTMSGLLVFSAILFILNLRRHQHASVFFWTP